MRRQPTLSKVFVATLLLALFCWPQAANAELINGFDVLDTLFNTFRRTASGEGVSGDGLTIVGSTRASTFATTPVRWDELSGPTLLGSNSTAANAAAADFDGNAITGTLESGRAFFWSPGSGLIDIGLLPGGTNSTSGADISSDGTTVVGLARGGAPGRGFRWTQSGGIVDLGTLPGVLATTAAGVNGDGSVIVGSGVNISGHNFAIKWDTTGADTLPGLPGGNDFANALDVNDDGSVVVGWSYSMGPIPQATRWVDGVPQPLGLPPGSGQTLATHVSADGGVVAGTAGPLGSFIWTEKTGMRLLSTIVEELNIDMQGYGNPPLVIDGMSADGRVLTGTTPLLGTSPVFQENRAFRLVISEDIGIALVGEQEYAFSDATITGGGTVRHLVGGMSHGATVTSTGSLVEESNMSERTFLFAPNAIGDGDQNATVNALLEGALAANPGGSANVEATVSVLDELDNLIGSQTRTFSVSDGQAQLVNELFSLNLVLTPGETYNLVTSLSVSALNGSADFGNTFTVQVGSAIPEPNSVVLLALGGLIILGGRYGVSSASRRVRS